MKFSKSDLIFFVIAFAFMFGIHFVDLKFGQNSGRAEAVSLPQPCVCSDYTPLSYRGDPRKQSIFRMALFYCQCGQLKCAVSERAMSCVK